MSPGETLVLTRKEVAGLLTLGECIAVVEQAFRLHAEGRALPPGILGVRAPGGGFHVKAAGLPLSRAYFAAKTNANFPENPTRHGLPAIQGVIVLCDGADGRVLALMDSIEITIQRTGAATAVAVRYLAREDASSATICGCGHQGRIQLKALAAVRPLQRAFAFDVDPARAERFAAELSAELSVEVVATRDLGAAVRASDVCVTCTPSRTPFLGPADVRPGAFVAAVGADSEDKQELDPTLLASSAVVVDVLEQCAAIGELHHALHAGLVTREAVRAELGDVVAGRKPGRLSEEEIVVFDSTGTALQDVAAAAAVYEKAVSTGRGLAVRLGER